MHFLQKVVFFAELKFSKILRYDFVLFCTDIFLKESSSSTPLGVFVEFTRCFFVGNSAEQGGGAFGSAFHILAVNTKPVEFTDW